MSLTFALLYYMVAVFNAWYYRGLRTGLESLYMTECRVCSVSISGQSQRKKQVSNEPIRTRLNETPCIRRMKHGSARL